MVNKKVARDTMALSEKQLNATFDALVAAAVAGERCPQSQPFGPFPPSATGILARAGRIRVEIFTLNWRVVTIMEGPHRGKTTAPCPHSKSGKPYKVIGKDNAPPATKSEG